MTENGYNGWANYPTWCVNLWITNDEGFDGAIRELVAEVMEDVDDLEDAPNRGVYEVGLAIEAFVDELVPDLEGFPADLMGWAMGHVEWREIAESFIADLVES